MRIVIAPDSFKGTATAAEVAAAVEAGWRSVRPEDDVQAVPMADGGEGSLDAFAAVHPAAIRHGKVVHGPVGEPVAASWLELPGSTGVVELAVASGITLLPRLQPERADTAGFGELLRAAVEAGMTEVVACIGGSASNDGGAGMLTALGARLLDDRGAPIAPGPAGLDGLARVDLTDLLPLPPCGVRVVTDVDAPLLGPAGATAVFGAQKGVPPAQVARYEERLAGLADLLGVDPDAAGAGAAGGTGAALLAWGATLNPGAREIAEALGLPARLAAADLLITGEGRFDGQSAAGKVPDHLARLARDLDKTAMLVAGSIVAPTDLFSASRSLVDLAGSMDAAMADPARWLHEAGAALARVADRSR